MANEVNVIASLAITANSVTASGSLNTTISLASATTSQYATFIVTTASTTQEAIVPPTDIAYGGYLFIKNLDTASNQVISLGASPGVTNTVATLLPGEACLFKPAVGSTVYLNPTAGGNVAVTMTDL